MSYFRQYKPSSQNKMPPGVLNLIVLNFIFFIAKVFAASKLIDLDFLLGLHHPFSPDFHFFQYITSLFMHGDFWHITFNMIGLWMFGQLLENAYGTKRFLVFYFVSGLGASLIYQGWETFAQYHEFARYGGDTWELMHLKYPAGYLIGASGAVYGVMMGAALLFPNTQLYYFGFMGFPIKLKWLAVIYGLGELYRAWHQDPGDNTAHFAHIGGMIFGFILVKIYSRNKTNFY